MTRKKAQCASHERARNRLDCFEASAEARHRITMAFELAVRKVANFEIAHAAERGTSLSELLEQVDPIIHGTTATTNALLTRTGARTAILTTEGFRDIIELRRGIRIGHSPYNLKVPFPKPIVGRDRIR